MNKILKKYTKKYISEIKLFLFLQDHKERLAAFRIVLCGTLFYIACYRQLVVEQFGENALIPRAQAFAIFPDYYKPLIQLFFWPDGIAYIVHFIYIILLLAATLGILNRPFLFLTWVLAQGFIQRNYSVLFGADVIGTLLLFYLAFTNCQSCYTIKNLFSKLKTASAEHNPNHWGDQISSLFFRLLQIQIFTIYMYTGFEKLKGTTWWDGTALWTVFVNPQFTGYDLVFLKSFPLFFAIGTFVTIVFEVYFPVMVAFRKTRYLWLGMGILFHLQIGILLSLMSFSLVMASTYFLFLDRLDLIRSINFVKQKIQSFR